jgi:bacterioferritin-associated ferredoxin
LRCLKDRRADFRHSNSVRLEPSMIVCSCNLLTDAKIREALTRPNPPKRVRDVYATCGCTAKCGGCAGSINRLINESGITEKDSAQEQLDAA